MSTRAAGGLPTFRRSGVLLDRIATFVFCLSALSFGWWLGGGFEKAEPERLVTSSVATEADGITNTFDCGDECSISYLDYLDAERARARAWRHGGP
jgi:hypothetical protein